MVVKKKIRSKMKRTKMKRTKKRSLKRRSSRKTKKTKINRKKKKTKRMKRMKGGMEAQVGVAGGAAPTKLQSLKPTGEELKAIVLKRKLNDDFGTRVANRQEFFDKARELLQSADTITIDYESHFTPEFKELLAKNPEVNFSSLPEFEKYKLASDFNFLKEVIGALFGRNFKEHRFFCDILVWLLCT